MLKFLSKLLDSNEKEIKKMAPVVEKINSLEPKFSKLKDSAFPKKTKEYKERIAKGESLDALLPEGFALAREAIRRTVGERAYDVQLMAAIALHQGKIAEQKTGEGKTLSAAIAAYLNALSGKGVHIVTVNDYLARRDTGWYGQALNFAGLSLGCIIHEEAFLLDPEYKQPGQDDERLRHLRPGERKEAYLADITYGTNNEFGFDYLRDNMAHQFEEQVQRKHHYAIVDEVDSILIDEARTPLIISAPDTEPTQKYYQFAEMTKNLAPETDYAIDEKLKTANLTDYGIRRVERLLGIENLYKKDFDTIHHIENALRARALYHRDKDYVVKDDQVIIVDEFTGRLMFGRRWSDGLHQAIEAKEGVKIQQESITMATISFQNYFRMYKKLSGMTGTAITEAEEFEKIYKLGVMVIPTNKPMIRVDNPDIVYKTVRAKIAAVVGEIGDCFKRGQPVLVGTTSIENNEIVSKFLEKRGIPHNVLNAKQHEKEAKIIADAGKKKAVTVATNMAGRGVDIVLGGAKAEGMDAKWQEEHNEVVKLGGLHVIGSQRHESRRIDNQLRGRSGRQGDPGSSRFFVSLEDDIMRLFGGEQISHMMEVLKIPEDQPIEHGMVSRAIEQAQIRVEGFNFDMRKRVLEYDDVMNKQREIIYGKRQQLLEGKNNLKKEIQEKINDEIIALVASTTEDMSQVVNNFCEILPLDDASQSQLKQQLEKVKEPEKITTLFTQMAEKAYEFREKQLGEAAMRELERLVYLFAIDRLWIDHLDIMDDLREGVGLRGANEEERIVLYKKEAFEMFEKLMGAIDGEIVRRIFRVQPVQAPAIPPSRIQTNIDTTDSMGLAARPTVLTHALAGKKKIGRNDPCWCGSGKKWKKCHYPQVG
jgi:preprotein translocase subunit SecA